MPLLLLQALDIQRVPHFAVARRLSVNRTLDYQVVEPGGGGLVLLEGWQLEVRDSGDDGVPEIGELLLNESHIFD